MPVQFVLLLLLSLAPVAMADKLDLLEQRLAAERKSYKNSYVLTPHKTNYLLPLTYQHSPNKAPYAGTNTDLQNVDVKFQFSVKLPVTRHTLFRDNGFLYFAYSSQSLWQAYNSDESSPFRDTNHEPEIMLDFTREGEWLGISAPLSRVGFSHQSNGQSGDLSRSWNRVYVETVLHFDDWYLSVKPWWRVPESKKRDGLDASGDDNPDIHKYMGYGELRAFRQLGDNEISVLLRNSLHGWQRSTVEINYSYPFNERVQGYIQIFHGYGETLLDYDDNTSRIGFGFLFSNWL